MLYDREGSFLLDFSRRLFCRAHAAHARAAAHRRRRIIPIHTISNDRRQFHTHGHHLNPPLTEIFHRGRRVASHVREYGRRRFITEPEHMPAAHRAHLEWTPSKLIAWGRSVGPPVAELVETILNTRPHPEHGYRACMGLKRLVKRYGPERMTAACQRALATRAISYASVQAILKNNLDRVPLQSGPPAKVVPIRHANLRGAAYYQQTLALLEA